MFTLHEKLAADTFFVTDLEVCRVLLMNDKQYPWLILVPRVDGCRDLFDVPHGDQAMLWAEMRLCHETLKKMTNAPKMNVGALGNMVPQLHIHLIARTPQDAAWPKPVWGASPALPYTNDEAQAVVARLLAALSGEDEGGLDNGTAFA